MITVKARINITGTSKGNITGVDISPNGNNVSANGSALINKKGTSLGNPFILGRSILGTKAKYTKQLPYYMGDELANASGNFKSTYTIQVGGSNLAAVVIVFDKENRHHPNTIIVDGKTITDDDPQFEIPLSGSLASHTIQISNWNTPNEPLIITGIYADINIEINKTNLVSFRSDIMDRENKDYPSYGIISNSANLDFTDFDEQALDLIQQKILHSGITITTWIESEKTAEIRIWGEASSAEDTSYMEAELISGEIKVDDDLFFYGETATVSERMEDNGNWYLLRCVRNGKIAQNSGNVITVSTLVLKEQISEMEIRELTYENNNRQVQLSLKDNLEDMQNINVPSIYYDPRYPQSQTAEWYYRKLYDITYKLNKYNILSFDELDDETKNVLTGTVIQYPILESGSLWDGWYKLCQLCLLHMYIDNNNIVTIKYSV